MQDCIVSILAVAGVMVGSALGMVLFFGIVPMTIVMLMNWFERRGWL